MGYLYISKLLCTFAIELRNMFNQLLKFRMWFKYGLKIQKLQKQHALKGQKLLAQGGH